MKEHEIVWLGEGGPRGESCRTVEQFKQFLNLPKEFQGEKSWAERNTKRR